MVKLFGETYSCLELAQRSGALSQFAGVQAYELSDGLERGVRCLEFRTGTGFMFKVLVDRAMDVSSAEYCGIPVGWHSPAGFKNPALMDYEGEGGLGWLRSLSGLIVTCGLDHTLFMHEHQADHYNYSPKPSVKSSLHGRVSGIPAKLLGYGEEWQGDECILWCEGIVAQATVFGEDLHLIRRIEAKVGESSFKLKDRVVNHGFYRTPHMFLYHINIGHPVIAEGTEYCAPIRNTLWACHADDIEAQGVGYLRQPAPQKNFHEQVYEHEIVADANNKVPVSLLNFEFNRGAGIGFEVEFDKEQFPFMFQWQNYQEGQYAMGIEPSTNHVQGKDFAEERGELRWLEHGEEYTYETKFTVLDGLEEMQASKDRIRGIQEQPAGDYAVVKNQL